jgi:transcriptional regulator with XRE-family HTH domain
MTSLPSSSSPKPRGIGFRISQVRGRLTQAEFAQSLGVHKNTLIRYEKEERLPDSALLMRICERYEVNPAWLLLGTPEQVPTPNASECLANLDDYALISLYLAPEDKESAAEEPLAIKRSWLSQLRANPQDLRLFYVEGESMKPTLYPGDIVLANLHATAVHDGIYVLKIENVLLIKRLQRIAADEIRVSSDNATYKPWTMQVSELAEKSVVLGRVVRACRRL